jgi:hypothetical protein
MKDGNWWSLDAARINDLQQDSIVELVRLCKAAHFVDVHVRINGKWEVHEADWIKHLTPRPRPILAAVRQARWEFKKLRWRIRDALWPRRETEFAADCAKAQATVSHGREDVAE